MTRAAETGADLLNRLSIFSDRLTVDAAGQLAIAGYSASDLVAQYGSPLVVSVEETFEANYARILTAFSQWWRGEVRVLYSLKCNNNLAIRALLSLLGAGGDCFGDAELRATLETGTDRAQVALNGSDKTAQQIAVAMAAGVTINIDGSDELGFIEEIHRQTGLVAKTNLRLKVLPEELNHVMRGSGLKHGAGVESVRRAKWGFTEPAALPILRDLLASPATDVTGFSCHIGHLSTDPLAFAAIAGAFGVLVTRLSLATEFLPKVLDIGGGWSREREPEQRGDDVVLTPIEGQVEAAVSALEAAIAPLNVTPALWVEPGRYIVGNAQVLLASVGAVKEDAGLRWVHLDASTNNLQRIETGGFRHDLLPANRMLDPMDQLSQIVGGTCFRSVIGADRALPSLSRGDLVAVLDAGMYAEVFANQFNGVPRPAGVLLCKDGSVELIRKAETYQDIFGQHILPARFAPSL
ncbi:hypothetical protein Q9295_16275 [Xinfangfangia sp. CPCC 101601]|uniref:Orn/DAP/Arg decarboxylase 2 N-terminal domain-containing protein n=1 Tax=Pseudogemmobacter lacusdianii TaxID=3069608 RepID=A0ABU0W2C5_9RHOB|nr:hypothetical protein [Xinfangfangia sp. CPCC 101601]MDQ2067933.1 hypothetical protein [Xinfangfangia sp. CPCC 101601]